MHIFQNNELFLAITYCALVLCEAYVPYRYPFRGHTHVPVVLQSVQIGESVLPKQKPIRSTDVIDHITITTTLKPHVIHVIHVPPPSPKPLLPVVTHHTSWNFFPYHLLRPNVKKNSQTLVDDRSRFVHESSLLPYAYSYHSYEKKPPSLSIQQPPHSQQRSSQHQESISKPYKLPRTVSHMETHFVRPFKQPPSSLRTSSSSSSDHNNITSLKDGPKIVDNNNNKTIIIKKVITELLPLNETARNKKVKKVKFYEVLQNGTFKEIPIEGIVSPHKIEADVITSPVLLKSKLNALDIQQQPVDESFIQHDKVEIEKEPYVIEDIENDIEAVELNEINSNQPMLNDISHLNYSDPQNLENGWCWKLIFEKTKPHNFGYLVPFHECLESFYSPYYQQTQGVTVCTNEGGIEISYESSDSSKLLFKIACIPRISAMNVEQDSCWKIHTKRIESLELKRLFGLEAKRLCNSEVLPMPFHDHKHIASRFSDVPGGIQRLYYCNRPETHRVIITFKMDSLNKYQETLDTLCDPPTPLPQFACIEIGFRCLYYS